MFSVFVLFAVCCLSALEASKPPAQDPPSNNFFTFDDAPYFTSSDKRIGAKIIVDPSKVGSTMAATVHLTFLPGAHIKSHRHVYVTEVIYVLKGSLTLRIGKEIKVMGPDTAAFIPPQVFHEYLNDSSDIVQFLQYFSPGGPEEEYRNWEKPGDSPASSTIQVSPKSEEKKHIISPPLPVVPGSPVPKLGTLADDEPGLDLNSQPAQATATDNLKLKSSSLLEGKSKDFLQKKENK